MTVPVLAIVGFSNSGKTTLMEKLIVELASRGLRVASIKHSHHQPEMDTPGKDSWRHKQAGAQASMLVGPEKMLMVVDIDSQPTPRQLADCYFSDYDLVLVEGYASMACRKVEVVRGGHSTDLRCDEQDLLAVVTDMEELSIAVPKLKLNDVISVADFIVNWAQGEREHG
ncbi:MAG: molybdopterin-guanine dinucleotide biosynthesis protein B [Mariprofundaceae bacterium]|nr:molybdopterin-guanine dinucleotide biosynthesis protein B [Mariprofundaceae bacterium]